MGMGIAAVTSDSFSITINGRQISSASFSPTAAEADEMIKEMSCLRVGGWKFEGDTITAEVVDTLS